MTDTFHQEYGELSEVDKATIKEIKITASEIEGYINAARENGKDSRCLALAMTNLEQSVMWAVKAITKNKNQ